MTGKLRKNSILNVVLVLMFYVLVSGGSLLGYPDNLLSLICEKSLKSPWSSPWFFYSLPRVTVVAYTTHVASNWVTCLSPLYSIISTVIVFQEGEDTGPIMHRSKQSGEDVLCCRTPDWSHCPESFTILIIKKAFQGKSPGNISHHLNH